MTTARLIMAWRATRKLLAPVMNSSITTMIDQTIAKLKTLREYEEGENNEPANTEGG